jgi:hypothetical protein
MKYAPAFEERSAADAHIVPSPKLQSDGEHC